MKNIHISYNSPGFQNFFSHRKNFGDHFSRIDFKKHSLLHSFWTQYMTNVANPLPFYADLGSPFHVSPAFQVTKIKFMSHLYNSKMISISGNSQCLYDSIFYNVSNLGIVRDPDPWALRANLNPDGQPLPYQENCKRKSWGCFMKIAWVKNKEKKYVSSYIRSWIKKNSCWNNWTTYLESLLNAVSLCFQAVLLCLLRVNLKLNIKNWFWLTDATVEKHPAVTKNSKKNS